MLGARNLSTDSSLSAVDVGMWDIMCCSSAVLKRNSHRSSSVPAPKTYVRFVLATSYDGLAASTFGAMAFTAFSMAVRMYSFCCSTTLCSDIFAVIARRGEPQMEGACGTVHAFVSVRSAAGSVPVQCSGPAGWSTRGRRGKHRAGLAAKHRAAGAALQLAGAKA